ncbi:hypothetical protein KBY96_16120 [Cyanobium sp. ATX 6A2]|uniref:hypothetical protein n=1 Tax=Cyanobium sp. ATX 6A2 TaxID=2823700 RepID=UPI0020CE17F5|nr:hypothetical protein [Cyanobium sp. ATX 6A2]MCP9889436.1 hypothetical protein [Cyanobium sp. ATX 6A2]
MGIAPSGRTLSLEQVLTPFPPPQNGEAENSYLGFCMSELCGRQDKVKYEKRGVLWGKEAALIDESLVRCLHDVYGFEFYSCYSELSSKLPGVENLGRLGRSDWQQLLHDCSFVLGFGKPVSGPTILESLYYGTPIFAPARQIPEFLHDSRNINLTDTLSTSELAIELGRCSFDEDDQITIDVISKEHFMGRFNRVFSLIADDQKRKANILLNECCLSGQMSLINTDCGAKLMSKSGTPVFEKQFNHEEAAKSRLGCEEVRFELIYIDSTFLQFRICDQRGKFLSSSPNGRLDFSRDIPKHWETFWARKTTTKNLHSCSSVIIEDFHGRQLFENYSIDIIVCSEGRQQTSLFEWILSMPHKGSKSLD